MLGRRRLVDDRAVRPPPPPLPAPRRLSLYRRAGHALRAILTDGGREDRGVCHQASAALGIEHRRAQPRQAWTKGFVERLQGTILTERWRCAFRRTYYTAVAPRQRDLDPYLRCSNFERTHQGYRLQDRTPAEVFDATA